MNKKKIYIVIGTRPEITKMFTLIEELKRNSNMFETKLIVTGQHREQMHMMLDCFDLKPDIDMDIMKPNQSLSYITSATVTGLDEILSNERPDMLLVHGDTGAALAAALTAFYHKVPVAHVEAGLRSHNKFSPWPEEVNRKAIDVIADLLFAPTYIGKENLLKENCRPEQIFVTGQTAVDAALSQRHDTYQFKDESLIKIEAFKGRMILVTAHRRENYGQPFVNMFTAIRRLADEFNDILFVYPVHLSPVVREAAYSILSGHGRILLTEPVDYMDMIKLMRQSYMVMSDSGGLQEETVVFNKPMVLMRDTTERPEGVESGAVYLSDVKEAGIYDIGRRLLTDRELYQKMASAKNPFGDGKASQRIVHIIAHYFGLTDTLPDEFC